MNYKHGMSGSRLYRVWAGMERRCLNPNDKDFKYYGGKGITICKDWLTFIPFYKWALTHGYTDDLTIDRIDSGGNYKPVNCQWITRNENSKKGGMVVKGGMISDKDRLSIRYLYKRGLFNQTKLSEIYNCGLNTINRIINFKEAYKKR